MTCHYLETGRSVTLESVSFVLFPAQTSAWRDTAEGLSHCARHPRVPHCSHLAEQEPMKRQQLWLENIIRNKNRNRHETCEGKEKQGRETPQEKKKGRGRGRENGLKGVGEENELFFPSALLGSLAGALRIRLTKTD